jgi:HEAT repeat protein
VLSTDPSVQALAAASLANAGKDAADAVDDLARALTTSKDPTVRRNCCIALGHIGSEARSAVPAIVVALKPDPKAPVDPRRERPFEEVREQAAEALAQIGFPANQAAVPAIRGVIARDKNSLVRQRCVWALFHIEEADLGKYDLTRVLNGVLDETGDEGLMVRYDCARLLAHKLRENASDKVRDLLVHMLTNRELRVFNKTDANIKGTGNEAAPGTSDVAPDLGGDARYMAAQALGWLGEKSSKNDKVIKALREAAKDKEPRLSKEAKASLETLKLEP